MGTAKLPGDCRTGFSSFRMFCKPPVGPFMVTGVESTRSRNQKDGRSLFAFLLGRMMFESLGIGGDLLSNQTQVDQASKMPPVSGWAHHRLRSASSNHFSRSTLHKTPKMQCSGIICSQPQMKGFFKCVCVCARTKIGEPCKTKQSSLYD